MNFTVKLIFLYVVLVVIYMCPNVKLIKSVCTFHTKICDSVKNYVHHGKNKPHQEVENGCFFVKNMNI